MPTAKLDPAHTSVELAVKHMMFTKVHGRFEDVQGELHNRREEPQPLQGGVRIGAASIDTGVRDRDEHLRSADFLDVENHPTISFVSRRIEGALDEPGDRFRVVGDLTIRDITRAVTVDVTYEGRGKDPWGNERAGFEAMAEIDRRDWGLEWNRPLETGGVLVGNTVGIELGVQAVREPAPGDKVA